MSITVDTSVSRHDGINPGFGSEIGRQDVAPNKPLNSYNSD